MNKLHFALAITAVALFALLMAVVAIGGYLTVSVGNLVRVMEAPAATTNITIDRLIIEVEDSNTTNQVKITLEGFESQVNSKLLDILAVAVAQ